MRPRNKTEKEVVNLSSHIKPLTKNQLGWLEEHVVARRIFTSGRKAWCTYCGTEYPLSDTSGETIECPFCLHESKVEKSRKRKYKGTEFASIITTHKGWQVIRYFEVTWESKKGEDPFFHTYEVMQKWCRPGTPMVTLGAGLKMYTFYCESPYSIWKGLSVKDASGWYEEWMKLQVYPMRHYLPIYRKIGLPKTFGSLSIEDYFGKVCSNPYLESLWKQRDWQRLKDGVRVWKEICTFWPSIRIALRHGFKIDLIGDYVDYLKMLRELNKDLHSPHYVAPADYHAMHDEILRQHRRMREEKERQRAIEWEIRNAEWRERQLAEELEREKEEARKEATFNDRYARYACLVISDDALDITPLMSIREFAEEGEAMNHCVFENKYYLDEDSLILSAKTKSGVMVETIEVDIKHFYIEQSRGKCNTSTEYHDEIINLVNANMDVIRSLTIPISTAKTSAQIIA